MSPSKELIDARPERPAANGEGGPTQHLLPPEPAAVGGPLTDLVEQVTAELAERWRRGERPEAAEYFDRHPELAADTPAAVAVVFAEARLRLEHLALPRVEELL